MHKVANKLLLKTESFIFYFLTVVVFPLVYWLKNNIEGSGDNLCTDLKTVNIHP